MSHQVFLRRPEVGLAVAALALLVAPLASLTSVANYVSSHVETLVGLVRLGRTYVVVNASSPDIAGSRVGAWVSGLVAGVEGVERVFPQRLSSAVLEAASGSCEVRVRAVGDLGGYLRLYGGSARGSVPLGTGEACVGEVLARIAGVGVGDVVTVSDGVKSTELRIVCVHSTGSALDAEVLVPLEEAGDPELSLVEFTLKPGASGAEVLARLAGALPEGLEVLGVQQLEAFVADLSSQTLALLGVWALLAYAAVAAASYAVSARLVAESRREVSTLRALGASRMRVAASLTASVALISLAGSALGVAAGLSAAQVVSTVLRWARLGVELSPFLGLEQALRILLLSSLASLLGSLHPILRSTRESEVERFSEVLWYESP